MIDNYTHFSENIFYIAESIPGPPESNNEYLELLNNFNSQITHCCDCVGSCFEECPCSKLCIYNNSDKDFLNNKTDRYIIECNDMCSCSETCNNRIVQKGPLENLEFKMSSNKAKGYGLFTKKLIPKGTYICEYAGEIITGKEALKRHSFNSINKGMNYIFCLNEIVSNQCIQTYIDPSVFGNIGRYINHSCNPNAVVIPVRINCPIPKLAIFCCRDIYPGSEITFNYGTNNLKLNIGNELRNTKICLCESPQCKGTIPFDPY